MTNDGRFMEKDLPRDDRPVVTKWHTNYDFQHPFPHVQVERDFDADYIRDENKDNGEWKAQEHYDHLRIHIAKVQAEVDRLREKADFERQLLDDASGEERRLEGLSQRQEHESDAARAGADRAQAEVARLRTAVEQAKADVQREKRELAGCQEDLVDARELLERLQRAEEQAKTRDQEHEAQRPQTFDGERPTKPTLAEAETVAADHEVTVRSKSIYDDAERSYEHWSQKVQATMALLDRLAARLRAYRSGKDPDAVAFYKQDEDHGVKNEASSLGFGWPLWLLTVFLHRQGSS